MCFFHSNLLWKVTSFLWESCSLPVHCCYVSFWVFVVEWLSKLRKCVYYTIASTVAAFATVLIPCLVLSLFSVPGFFILALVLVCNSISSIAMYDCNLGFFVMYYRAFVDVVIMLLLFVLGIIVGFVALFRAVVVCLVG